MGSSFTHTLLGRTGLRVFRLGLSASYRPGEHTVRRAVDEGVNLFFGFGMDTQMTAVMRDVLRHDRDRFVIATGPYNYLWWHQNIRQTLEKRLRQFGTDHIDLFLFLGVMKEQQFPPSAREEMIRLRDEGKVRFVGLSCHDRKFLGSLATEGDMDVLMVRYNAAHRGAEQEVFPHLQPTDPGVISYTATRWTYLLRPPASWPRGERVPTPGMTYRFALSHPSVHAVLTAPRNESQLAENLAAMNEGPLSGEEMEFMRRFGDAVHHTKRWFM